jgi:quercetin dioxygenase-like cupin family protein
MSTGVSERNSAGLGAAGNQESFWFLGMSFLIKLSGAATAGRFTVIETGVPPRIGPPLHRHHLEDEYLYVLEGEFLFELDGRQIRASAGAGVFLPKGIPHTFVNVGESTGRILGIAEPAGLDAFFTEAAAASPGARPDIAALTPVFEKFSIAIVGPPLSVA